VNYTAIDISSPFTTKPVLGMTLGLGANAAFWFERDGDHFATVEWIQGAGVERVFPKEVELAGGETWDLEPVGVAPDGTLIGTAVRRVDDNHPGVMKALFEYRDLEAGPFISRQSPTTQCQGVTQGGRPFGTFQAVWEYSTYGHEEDPLRVEYPATFVGGEQFPVLAAEFDNPIFPMELTLFWSVGGFTPSVLSFLGYTGAGACTDPGEPMEIDVFNAENPIAPPLLADAGFKGWKGGTEFAAIFSPAPDQETLAVASADGPTVVGSSIRLTDRVVDAPEGSEHPYIAPGAENPVDFYTRIPGEYVKQIKLTTINTISPNGRALVRAGVLTGNPGAWTDRILISETGTITVAETGGAEPSVVVPQYMNDLKLLAAVVGGKAKVLLPFEILIPEINAQGTYTGKLVSASKLAIGTLENSFESTATRPLKADWIEEDPDRFYIRMTYPGHSGKGPIKVRVWTDSDGTDYDDDNRSSAESEVVDLIEEGTTGVFTSKSMLLTSNDGDDDHPVDGVGDDAKNDRTRKIALGGKVKFSFWNTNQRRPTTLTRKSKFRSKRL
jgi:hypothetical protein